MSALIALRSYLLRYRVAIVGGFLFLIAANIVALIQPYLIRRHLEIRIRWGHPRKKSPSKQAGDFPGEQSPAERAILPARRRHSIRRDRSPLERYPVRADGAAADAEWPPKPAALRPASDRLARY